MMQMPGTEEQLVKESTTVYIILDPTSDSLYIGSLVSDYITETFTKFWTQTNCFNWRRNWNDWRSIWKSDEKKFVGRSYIR
jgi:hypothetical protein